MPRILHVLSSLRLGGAERITIELAKLQRREGYDAQILSLGASEDFLVAVANQGGIPLQVSEKSQGRFSRYQEIRKLTDGLDVLHLHSPYALKFLGPLLPFLKVRKIVYTRHGLEALDKARWKLTHFLSRPFIHQTTFVAQSGYDVFLANQHWNEERMRVISNGVFTPDSYQCSTAVPVRFGSVGRMVPVKAQWDLLEAVDRLSRILGPEFANKFELKFFGSGPLEGQLREQAEGLSLDNIAFCGEEPDIEKIYEQIDVIVVSSESEGLSMVIMEGMARGRPAIATDVGGNSTLVKQKETGLLVPYKEPEKLAQAMQQFINKPDLVERYGSNARKLIEQEYSLQNAHRAYLACYFDT